jgi:hypothetical protein
MTAWCSCADARRDAREWRVGDEGDVGEVSSVRYVSRCVPRKGAGGPHQFVTISLPNTDRTGP